MAELKDETVQTLIGVINRLQSSGAAEGPHFRGQTDPAEIRKRRDAELELADGVEQRAKIEKEAAEAQIAIYKKQRDSASLLDGEYQRLTADINKLEEGLKDLGGQMLKVNKFFSASELHFKETANRVLALSNNFTIAGKAVHGLLGPFTSLVKAFKKGGLRGGASAAAKGVFGLLGSVLLKIASNSLDFALSIDKAAASFRKATGAGYGYEKIIHRTGLAYLTYGINAQDAGAAVTGLFGSFREFTELSASQQGNIATTTAILSKFGISAQQQGEILNTATKSLGMNVAESERLLREFEAIAKSVGKPISEIARDFSSAAPKIAFYGAQAVNVFKELEQQSKSTGLSVDKLLGTFGDQFDTFEGAGKAVGRLNALLGGPYLNSIDMLNASESERLEMLQDSMKASGTLFSDLNKFEQKAFASALGTDVDTLRKSMQELDPYQQLQVMRQEQLARKAGQARDIIQKLKDAFQSWVLANPKFLKSIVSLVDKFSDWTQKNHDLVKLWKKDIKPTFDKYADALILITKLFVIWKLAMAGSWALGAIKGIMGITKSMNVLTLAQTRAITATRTLGFAGAALGVGMATGAGVNYFRKQGNQGAANATGVLGGAATGALIGSIIPGVGTAIGAGIGGVAGGIGGLMYANRDANDVAMTPDGPLGMDSADRPFYARDGSVVGFGVQGGALDKASREVFAPRGSGAGNQNMSAMMPALVAAVREGVSSATVNANVAVQAGSGLKQGMFDFIDDANSPMNPFNQGSY
jgi:hypothetical protein